MRSGRPEGDAPSRTDRKNRDGSVRVYWVASKEARGAGYEPETVRIHEIDGDVIAARCRAMQAEMLQWLVEPSGAKAPKGPPSVNDLVKAYRSREESAYHSVKRNTRRTYDKVLDTMERGFGETSSTPSSSPTFSAGIARPAIRMAAGQGRRTTLEPLRASLPCCGESPSSARRSR